MTVFMGVGLKDLNDREIPGSDGNPATVRGVVMDALVAAYQDEAQLSGEEKLKRWELAMKIKNATDPTELSAEEISLAKKLVGKAYGALVVGQVWSVLEGK